MYYLKFMISSTGKNLSILIVTEAEKDWQTFATWYSAYKNLPESRIAMVCHRSSEIAPFVYYQWAKRLKVPIVRTWPFSKEGPEYLNWLNAIRIAQDKQFVGDSVLVVRPHTVILEPLDQKLLDSLNSRDIWTNDDAWFLRSQNTGDLINSYYLEGKEIEKLSDKLCVEAKESDEIACIVSYKKGCGRWIDTSKGCPFSSAAGLVSEEMTANETRVIELWKKLVPLYNAVT